LEQDEFALDRFTFAEIDHDDDIDQLVELLDDLVDHLFVLGGDDQRHPGDGGVMAGPDVERMDIESTPTEHPGDTSQDAEFVLNENGDGMAMHISVADRAGKGRTDWPFLPGGQPKSPEGSGRAHEESGKPSY